MNQLYLHTARLLTQVAPLVFVDGTPCGFAKGVI